MSRWSGKSCREAWQARHSDGVKTAPIRIKISSGSGRSGADGRGLQRGLAVFHVDLELDRLAGVLLDELIAVGPELHHELLVCEPVGRLPAPPLQVDEFVEHLAEVLGLFI